MSYQPIPETIAAKAIEFIEKRLQRAPKGAWVPNSEVCAALGVRPNAIRPSLDKAIEVGLVEKSLCSSGFTQWRLGYIKPRRRPAPRKEQREESQAKRFSIDWPPGFVSQYDSVKVAQLEVWRR